jgi:hypothetical protein
MHSMSSEGDNNNDNNVPDGEDLQALFAKHCDKDGLMTKQMLKGIPAIQELLVCVVCICCFCVFVFLCFCVLYTTQNGPVMNTLCSRITPQKECRILY